jgi:hypothetical protein
LRLLSLSRNLSRGGIIGFRRSASAAPTPASTATASTAPTPAVTAAFAARGAVSWLI